MLREVNDMAGSTIAATDGHVGHVRDFYFDDEAWVIRYLIVETGTWLLNRIILVSPLATGERSWDADRFTARLTREQVRNSPSIDAEIPVSRQNELEFHRYYGYPYYWAYFPRAMLTGPGDGGTGFEYLAGQVEQEPLVRKVDEREDDDPHLRSCKVLTGYHIEAADGEIGRVQDMLVDEESWAIRYLIVNTSSWWSGHQILVAPEWITEVSWSGRTVAIDLTRQAIQDAPPQAEE